MKLCDFIYHYAEYCRVNVDATLLMENWTDKDDDEKYGSYLQEYIRLKNVPVFHQKTNVAVLLLQTERVRETYRDLTNEMLKNLKVVRTTISEAKEEAIKKRLDKVTTIPNEISYDFIEELRKIEEEEF